MNGDLLKNVKADANFQLIEVLHKHEGSWWFWDEAWSERMGPYDSEDEARKAMNKYVDLLLEQIRSA